MLAVARTTAERRRSEALGRFAEAATVALYLCLGYRPLARRLRTPVGELDLIVRRGATLVAVEVKMRVSADDAAAAITARNRRRIVDATRWWLALNPTHARYTIRFDVVLWSPWSWPRRIAGAFEAER
jgi:putative endonuclease